MVQSKTVENDVIKNLNEIIKKIRLGEKYFLRNIVITPIYLQIDLTEKKEFLSLDESIEKNYSIKITDTGNINQVNIQNNTENPLFVMDGEQLTGGLQNRMFVHSFTLEPQRRDNYKVFCIEAGRWNGNTRVFNTQNDLSYSKVRLLNLITTRTKLRNKQDIIWKEIENKSKNLNYYSKTSSLTDLNRFMDRTADDYIANYKYSNENGYLVEHNDNIVSIEILNENSMVQKLYKKMLKSYIYDAIGIENDKLYKVRDIANENLQVKPLRETEREKEFHIYNNRIEGKFYSYKDDTFHLSLFNNRRIAK